MLQVALAELRGHAARLLATTLAIVIAVAFVVGTLILNRTANTTILRTAAAQYVGADLVIMSTDANPVPLDAVSAVPGVIAVAPSYETVLRTTLPDGPSNETVRVRSVAADPVLRWQRLEGRLPNGPGQLAVSARTGARVGDVLSVTTTDPAGTIAQSDVTVTGLVDLGGDVNDRVVPTAFVTEAQAVAWAAPDPTEARMAGPLDPAEVRTALAPAAVTVQTGAEAAEASARALLGGATTLTAVLLVFATIAVVVAGLVIANTFAVILAQRARELALLRCLGATSAQVRRGVLGEAVATGLLASAVGVAAGTGLAALISAAARSPGAPLPLAEFSVPTLALVGGLVGGTAVTVLAAHAPVRGATRVAPLAAVRPPDVASRARAGTARFVIGLLLAVVGGALVVQGVRRYEVLIALPGGVLSFLGVVALTQRVVPAVIGGAGRVVRRSVSAELAAGNAARNPRRTAAVATALLIGVTLTSAIVVGAASTRATSLAGLDSAYPTDVVIDGGDRDLPPPLLSRIPDVPGVAATTVVTAADVPGPGGTEPMNGVDPESLRSVLRSTATTELPGPGEVVLTPGLAQRWAVGAGEQVILGSGRGARAMTVVLGAPDLDVSRLTDADLAGLVPAAAPRQVWLRLTDGGDQAESIDAITQLTSTAAPLAQVEGLAAARDGLTSVLNTLLLIVTALLGIAVLIALIGVGNTLSLSVIERRQESGLMRALGLTRQQLKRVLAWEAVLISGVAAVLGVALGVAYGLAGAVTVLGALGPVVVAVPWIQVGAIVVVAVLAGLAASVLPARRAARASPVAALAPG